MLSQVSNDAPLREPGPAKGVAVLRAQVLDSLGRVGPGEAGGQPLRKVNMSAVPVEPLVIPRVTGSHQDKSLARARKARAIELRMTGMTYQ